MEKKIDYIQNIVKINYTLLESIFLSQKSGTKNILSRSYQKPKEFIETS
jgi:hypothetical protein